MVLETKDDCQVQERYWFRLTQFRFDLNYYSYYFKHCVKCQRWIKGTLLLFTTLFTSIWTSWGDYASVKWICSIAILALQTVNSISEIFPYENRKQELREMGCLLEPVYDEMESDWLKVASGEMSVEEIDIKILEYARKRREIEQHYFKDDALPDNVTIKERATSETNLYFETRF